MKKKGKEVNDDEENEEKKPVWKHFKGRKLEEEIFYELLTLKACLEFLKSLNNEIYEIYAQKSKFKASKCK